jgi:hypothetical protein
MSRDVAPGLLLDGLMVRLKIFEAVELLCFANQSLRVQSVGSGKIG